jgi:hypothetical protein
VAAAIAAVVFTALPVSGPVAAMVAAGLVVARLIPAMVVTGLLLPGPIAAMVVTRVMVPGVAYLCPIVGDPVVMAAVVHATYGRVVGRVGPVRRDGQRDRDAGAAEDGCCRKSDKGSGAGAAHGHSRD